MRRVPGSSQNSGRKRVVRRGGSSHPGVRKPSHARRPAPRAPRHSSAFTLIEIMLVVAVIALLSTVFITGIGVLTLRDEQTLEEVFEEAVREGKWLALQSERPVIMSYDGEERVFVLRYGGGEALRKFPVPSRADSVHVRFLRERPRGTYVLVRGEFIETEPVGRVTFFPDGGATPFTVELGYGADTWSFPVDPWTGARLPD